LKSEQFLKTEQNLKSKQNLKSEQISKSEEKKKKWKKKNKVVVGDTGPAHLNRYAKTFVRRGQEIPL
jgi:hypothetical protein